MHKHGVIDGGGEAGVSTPSWQPSSARLRGLSLEMRKYLGPLTKL